jgi:hypothetical protein
MNKNSLTLSLLAGGVLLLSGATQAATRGATPPPPPAPAPTPAPTPTPPPAPAPTPAPSPAPTPTPTPTPSACYPTSPCYNIVNAVGTFMGTGSTGDTSGSCVLSQVNTRGPGAMGALQCSGAYDLNGMANGINIQMTVFTTSSPSTGTSNTCPNTSPCYPIIQLIGQNLGNLRADFNADCTPALSGDLSGTGYLTCPGAIVDAAGNTKEISVIVTTTPNTAARRKMGK